MFGRTTSITEWGIRIGRKATWGYASEADAKKAIGRMRGASKKSSGTIPMLIQRTVKVPSKPKKAVKAEVKEAQKCRGGKCKNGYMCTKHSKTTARGSDYTPIHLIPNGVQEQRRPDGKKY